MINIVCPKCKQSYELQNLKIETRFDFALKLEWITLMCHCGQVLSVYSIPVKYEIEIERLPKEKRWKQYKKK